MRQISLLSVPNQSFSVTIDGTLWEIALKTARNVMFADISRDGDVVLLGQRVLPDQPIIPYRYLSTYGNFAILTSDDELPDWQRFNIDQVMIYLTPRELGIDD